MLQTLYSEVRDSLQLLGFEPGWGHNIERAWDTMNMALDLQSAHTFVSVYHHYCAADPVLKSQRQPTAAKI